MKIKDIVIIFSLLVLANTGMAQYTGADFPQAYSSFNVGYAMPIGSFGLSTSDNWVGYAKGGLAYTIQVGIPVAHSNFGVAIMAGYNKNNFDAATYEANLAKNDTANTYSAVTAIAYKQYYLMAGLMVTTNSKSGFSIDGHVVIGVDYINYPSPYWTTTQIGTGYSTQWFLTTAPTTTFAIAIGGGARYAFDNGFTILANAIFLRTSAMTSTTQIIDNTKTNGQAFEYPTNAFSMSCISVSLGLGYSL